MDNVGYIQYCCLMIPMLLSLFVMERRARVLIGSILAGCTVCLFVSELNGLLFLLLNKDLLFFCTTVSPVTEEVIKSIPILVYAFLFSDKRKDLVQISFALGLGFAIMENMNLLAQSIDTVTVLWAVARCFGAGLMHSLCTVVVGLGISYVKKKKKLFVTGTLALVMTAITYHAVYNTIAMSPYKYFGFVLPLATYLPALCVYFGKKIKVKKEAQKV